ncbi:MULTISPECIES: TetR/AcrR family transcriptional regulator [Comamonas]|uniref:TetR/AcrR family transcriptional regulator n=1 Tax=Comamonas TaxID=283 RepID=UPI0006B90F9D|nr:MULTISPECIES: TetR/AcrR family transcriptional regulator [Comamonas]MBL5976174.1 TetR/AcrR family transcriptional regulator [Comamonas sp. NyZ500]QOQ84435.1 TetR/AcrR family transcriptional regulator [Comamonas thiooxydans]UUE94935.1 TetR/AcrR family transcriptional regulator [Comamonas thiooxydans]BDB69912.1 TetR family transcriptional regulator [Comamonas thiooxydans]
MSTTRPPSAERRAQLLDAADAVFAEHGVTAPLDLIVERAQVGRATLYRQFPDRRAIMLALLERSVEKTRAAAAAWKDDDQAFFKLLALVGERIAVSATLVDYWRTVDQSDAEVIHARQQMWLVFEEPMKRAVAKGLCKQTLNAKDLSLVFGMLGGALRGETPAQRKQLARRALQIILDGIKA